MKTVFQIAKALNVGVSSIIEYLERLGHASVSANTKVSSDLEEQIVQVHEGKNVSEEKDDSDGIAGITELPQQFNYENPFAESQLEILTSSDLFSNRLPQKRKFQDQEFDTIFSDFEAFSICLGLDNRRARNIAREFFKLALLEEEKITEAHQVAAAALEKYGSKMLSFILALPPLPFKALDATQIFSELDKRREKRQFPIIRIAYLNERNESEKIKISYYVEKIDNERRRNVNVLTVENKTTGREIMKLSRNGIVAPESNAKQIIPVLQLFLRFSKDTKRMILNYGLETGECSICGRELTDPKSIRMGIGPHCGKNQ